MKKHTEIKDLQEDKNQNLIFNIFKFLELAGVINIETIMNYDGKGMAFRVNKFINASGYEKHLHDAKRIIIIELKSYLSLYDYLEQNKILQILKLKLIRIWGKVLVNCQDFDDNNDAVSVNRFAICYDTYGFFTNYNNCREYVRIWEKIFNEIFKEIDDLIKDVKSGINNNPYSQFSWLTSDTDFIELVISLIESRSINNQTNNLSRKEAVSIFESMFNIKIKDFDSKLSRARARKTGQTPYLDKLKQAFIDYCNRKDD